MVLAYSKSMENQGKCANPARGQLYRENECFRVQQYVWSSDTARVWNNEVRLPILVVVSCSGKMNISLSLFVRA